jgi:hypothetical protein
MRRLIPARTRFRAIEASMPVESAVSSDSGAERKGAGLPGTLVVLASVAAQAILIVLFIQRHRPYGLPSGESHAFAGMGLLALSFAALWVIVPGTLISLWRAVSALIALIKGQNAGVRLVFNLLISLLPSVRRAGMQRLCQATVTLDGSANAG